MLEDKQSVIIIAVQSRQKFFSPFINGKSNHIAFAQVLELQDVFT